MPDNGDLHQLAKAVQSQLLISDDDAGTSNAYQVTMTPAPTAHFKYMTVICKIGNTNTGASVLNVNALGPKPIRHPADNSELSAGELKQGAIACFIYDGVYFHLVWSSGGAASVSGGTIYLTKPVDFYVDANIGNDTYDGLSAAFTTGIHGPFRTLQKASNTINPYNLNGFDVRVHVADGNYGAFRLPSPSGTGTVSWLGNNPSPANCLVYTDNYTAVSGSQIGNQIMQGFKLKSSGVWTVNNDPLCCLYLSGNMSTLSFGNMEFGGSPGAMVSVVRRRSTSALPRNTSSRGVRRAIQNGLALSFTPFKAGRSATTRSTRRRSRSPPQLACSRAGSCLGAARWRSSMRPSLIPATSPAGSSTHH
ncbi:hypothetical protein ACVME8_003938 [Bradyrhizobium diazoefficiens]